MVFNVKDYTVNVPFVNNGARSFGLESHEYMITSNDVDSENYEITYKGKKINSVIALVIDGRLK